MGIVRKPRALKRATESRSSRASPFNRDEFTRGVAEIERLGFVPTFEDSVFEKDSSYLAGSPEVRASAFMRHWSDPSYPLLAVRADTAASTICHCWTVLVLSSSPNCSSATATTPRCCRG